MGSGEQNFRPLKRSMLRINRLCLTLQPGGLAESSRGSKRSADPRASTQLVLDPERVAEIILAPRWGALVCAANSGGLRFASTPGYFLPALRAGHIIRTS